MKQITVENVTESSDVISKQINIYKSDTQNSVTNRIARVFNTLPHFITFASFNLNNDSILFYDLKTFLRRNFKGNITVALLNYYRISRFSETSKNRDIILGEWLTIALEQQNMPNNK